MCVDRQISLGKRECYSRIAHGNGKDSCLALFVDYVVENEVAGGGGNAGEKGEGGRGVS